MLKKYSITIPLVPITKKNHQQIITKKLPNGKTRPMVIPSKQYRAYEKACADYLTVPCMFDYPVNVKAVYYMPTRRRVDLTNLHEALHDVLVHYHVLSDDNCKVIASTDGSRVMYDKKRPRTEIVITALEDDADNV